MRAKKSLGQHFLRSEKALNTIIKTGEIESSDTILEIGPGEGALTDKLLETGAKIIAVEKDDELFEFLKQKFEKEISSGQFNLIHDDILKFTENFKPARPNDFGHSSRLKIENYKLIANIPYNLTGAIFKRFLQNPPAGVQPTKIVLLVQKEVAQRIVGKPHSAKASRGKESILSISVKAYGEPRLIEKVLAGSFAPAPKVDSAIIAINNISKDFFKEFPEEAFFKMLRAGFQSKRKKLSSNLANIFDKEKVRQAFQKLNLDENTRAEDVGVEMWKKLAQKLKGSVGSYLSHKA